MEGCSRFIQLHWTIEVEGCSKVYSTALDKRSRQFHWFSAKTTGGPCFKKYTMPCCWHLKNVQSSKVYSTALDNRSEVAARFIQLHWTRKVEGCSRFIQLHWTLEVEGCSKVYSTALDKRSGRLQQGLFNCTGQ